MEACKYSSECMARCPELQSCANEFILRQAFDSDITLEYVIQERVGKGTLPPECNEGPVAKSIGSNSSRGGMEHVAQATIQKIDAWGDQIAISCRQQGRTGGGSIRPV